jgi:hypothetical protein
MPFGIRRLYMPIMRILREMRSSILPLYSFEGEELSTGNQIRVAYLGWDERISSYWVERLFRQKKQIRTYDLVPVWKTSKYLRNNKDKYDFGIIEINDFVKRIIRIKSGFLLPRWLELRLDIDASVKILTKEDILRRIRKHSLTVERRYSEDDFCFFYERMYKPYVGIRHRDSAVIGDYRYLLNIFKRKGSELYFVIKDGQPIAGSINEIINNTLRMSSLGILDGREDILRMGVIGALYFFQANEYYKRGIASVNIGGTSPILMDGLTQFKLSLGGKLAYTNYLGNQFIWLRPLVDSKAIRGLLAANPFISISEKSYYRNIFVDPEKENAKDELLRALKHTKCDDIKATRIYCFDNLNLAQEWVDKDEYGGVEFLKYAF